MSATPSEYEIEKSEGVVVEQIVRPTGLVDPKILLKPAQYQVDDLLEQIRKKVEAKQRVLVTTLTKKMSEDLTKYVTELDIQAKYLHSEVHTVQRTQIIRELRTGEIDVLIGVNLLREGLDLPEVGLVAILDADKAGFLRSRKALIQTAGRAARNIDGIVIFYADETSKAMQQAIQETNRRRETQLEYNRKNNITPQSINKTIDSIMQSTSVADQQQAKAEQEEEKFDFEKYVNIKDSDEAIRLLQNEMDKLAKQLRFEEAAEIRDRILELKEM